MIKGDYYRKIAKEAVKGTKLPLAWELIHV